MIDLVVCQRVVILDTFYPYEPSLIARCYSGNRFMRMNHLRSRGPSLHPLSLATLQLQSFSLRGDFDIVQSSQAREREGLGTREAASAWGSITEQHQQSRLWLGLLVEQRTTMDRTLRAYASCTVLLHPRATDTLPVQHHYRILGFMGAECRSTAP